MVLVLGGWSNNTGFGLGYGPCQLGVYFFVLMVIYREKGLVGAVLFFVCLTGAISFSPTTESYEVFAQIGSWFAAFREASQL